MAQCPETDPVHYRCSNCMTSGHAAWDRDCPVFIEHRRRLLARQPDSTYRFFPTADPSTWEQTQAVPPALSDRGRHRGHTLCKRMNLTATKTTTMMATGKYRATKVKARNANQLCINPPSLSLPRTTRSPAPRGPAWSYDQFSGSPLSSLPNMPERPNRPTRLRIWQQNLNKSLDAQLDLLHAANPDNYDLLLLQEPYLDHLNLTRANHHWTVVYPSRHHDDDTRSRSVILVSRKISTGAWVPISIPSPDLTAITILTNSDPVHIFNAYIEETRTALHALSRATQRLTPDVQEGRVIWAGDFNRHHPSGTRNPTTPLYIREPRQGSGAA
ncbi:hypothetical protein A0H81_02654 [Grifola frondosa]|uniref:Endonuclease/exonuclease/phosphatase domain-containing protein n=1 Tax=Grifola frondosa TaxID=5627 RepID=A0A1C7MPF2_GRIFR|nr:hypothetical protein A0H81_02654 [Grifola frondosa]